MGKCSNDDCYNSAMSSGICGECDDLVYTRGYVMKSPYEQISDLHKTLEQRVRALEETVKELKRQLGLK